VGGIDVNTSYAVEQVVYRDANVCYARGFACGQPDLLLCFFADAFDRVDAEKPPTAKKVDDYAPIEGELKLAFLPEGAEKGCDRLMPAVAFGCLTGWTVIAYRYLPVVPLWVYMPRVVVIRRREAVRFVGQVGRALTHLQSGGLVSGEVHAGNVFVDEERGENAFLAYNRNLGPKLYPKLVEANPNLMRFLQPSFEQLQGDAITEATDVFHLGVLAATMLKGSLFEVDDGLAAMVKDLPKGLDVFVPRALGVAAEGPFGSLAEATTFLDDDTSTARVASSISEAMADRYKVQAARLAPAKKKKVQEQQERRRQAREARHEARAATSEPPGEGRRLLAEFGPAVVLGLVLVYACWVGLSSRSTGLAPAATAVTRAAASTSAAVATVTVAAGPTAAPTGGAPPTPQRPPTPGGVLEQLEFQCQTATTSSTFDGKHQFLQQCFLKLPLQHREPAVGVATFKNLAELKATRPDEAFRELDGALRKLRDYARSNGVLQ